MKMVTRLSLIASVISFMMILGCSQGNVESQGQEDGPIARVKAWEKAIREDNVEGFMKHFTKSAQNTPEYVGGKEALRFWKDEIAGEDFSLDSEGFKGEWIKKEGEYKGRQIIFVHPIMPDGPSSEAVWVVKEEGEWRIEVLFNRPPKN